MMFGRPPPQKEWDDMYLFEKVQHLFDLCCDYVIGKSQWWIPTVAIGMALSVYLFGGAEGPVQSVMLASSALSPVARSPAFGTPVPRHPGADSDSGNGLDDENEEDAQEEF